MTDTASESEIRPVSVSVAASAEDIEAARSLAVDAARLLNDYDCEEVVVFDVQGLSQVTRFIVIASGTSDRQIKTLAGKVRDLAHDRDFPSFGSDRDAASTWLVLDFFDVMVHLFEPITRAHYDLEMLWGDAERVRWRESRAVSMHTQDAE